MGLNCFITHVGETWVFLDYFIQIVISLFFFLSAYVRRRFIFFSCDGCSQHISVILLLMLPEKLNPTIKYH